MQEKAPGGISHLGTEPLATSHLLRNQPPTLSSHASGASQFPRTTGDFGKPCYLQRENPVTMNTGRTWRFLTGLGSYRRALPKGRLARGRLNSLPTRRTQTQSTRPQPTQPTTPASCPRKFVRAHTCRLPAALPSTPGRRGVHPGEDSAKAPCARSGPSGPPVNSFEPRNPQPPRARGASCALPVLSRALPKSPHPLDISADPSAPRSASRQPLAVQRAP